MSRIKGKNSKVILFFSLIFVSTFCGLSQAKASEVTINDTLLKAISTNPEVQAKWHSFAASEKELASARGGYLPRLDLTAGLGRENLDGAGYEGRDMQNYTRDGITLSLNQMIYDGRSVLVRCPDRAAVRTRTAARTLLRSLRSGAESQNRLP